MTAGRVILHIGAPKCGSSALQTALTLAPDHRAADGTHLRYVISRNGRVVSGRRLRWLGRASPYGYVSWPSLVREAEDRFAQSFQAVLQQATRQGYVPILSNEGWIAHAQQFAPVLAECGKSGTIKAEVVAFVRPPLDWLNATYWQWGVWSGLDFETWLDRTSSRYRLGASLAAWAELPGVSLTVRSTKEDVVAGFADRFGIELPQGQSSNRAAPPALVGFLLRNRRFRPDAHASAVEFVFQRWCPPVDAERLWAFRPRHLKRLRADMAADVARLMAAIPADDAAMLGTDPRWAGPEPYEALLTRPTASLDDRRVLAALFDSLSAGVAAVGRAARRKPSTLPAKPAESAKLETWDSVIASALQTLLDLDEAARLGPLQGLVARFLPKAERPADSSALPQPVTEPAPRLAVTLGQTSGIETGIAALFPDRLRFDGPLPVLRLPLLLLCHTGQSGLIGLRDLLTGTGLVAGGDDVLTPAALADGSAASLPDRLAQVVNAAPSGARAFAMIASADQLALFYRSNLGAMFPDCHLIHVRRADPIEQAAALHKMQQVRRLSAKDRAAGQGPAYDFARIEALLRHQQEEYARIDLLGALHGHPVLPVLHEEVLADPAAVVSRLLALVGAEPPSTGLPRPQEVPEDPVVRTFASLFRAEAQTALRRR